MLITAPSWVNFPLLKSHTDFLMLYCWSHVSFVLLYVIQCETELLFSCRSVAEVRTHFMLTLNTVKSCLNPKFNPIDVLEKKKIIFRINLCCIFLSIYLFVNFLFIAKLNIFSEKNNKILQFLFVYLFCQFLPQKLHAYSI